jgi:hypothetical protein
MGGSDKLSGIGLLRFSRGCETAIELRMWTDTTQARKGLRLPGDMTDPERQRSRAGDAGGEASARAVLMSRTGRPPD